MSAALLHGTRWVDVRLYRRVLWAAGGLLLAAGAFVGWLRWAAEAYPERCDARECDTFLGFMSASELLSTAMSRGAVLLLAVPLVVGAFVAGPMVARELESGTYQVAWSQGVTPVRWLVSKVTTAAVVVTAGGLALMGLFRLGAWNFRDTANLNWYDRGPYELFGPAFVAYCLLGVAVGALTGLLVRRTLLALAASGLVTGIVLYGIGSWRWDLYPVHTAGGAGRTRSQEWSGDMPSGIMLVDEGVRNAAGYAALRVLRARTA
ncbi:ABC transporter permease [Streptomyces polyrhachis]|uniref:ABC transporter permease n=1 Tax=Streptomyces polyrhachis TaxID=1282885 RepID=A0ABW2GAX3_9ACTN